MQLIKNIKKNTIFLLLITTIIIIMVLKDDFTNITVTLASMDYTYILLAVFFFFLSICIKGYVSYIIVDNKEKISLKEAIKHNFITQFFNGITPFSTGGQPMEIYMLTKHNIKLSAATSITIQNFIFYQIALVIYGMLAVLYNSIFHLYPNIPILRNLVLIGFIINTVVAIILFLITFSEKSTKRLIHILIKVLSKIKLLKDYHKKINYIDNKIEEFHTSTRQLRKRKTLFIKGVILNLISLTCLYIIPLFIVYSLNDFTSVNVADTLTSSAYILIMGAFIPIPGASGGIEYGFIKFYGNFLTQHTVKAVLLIWRFITYYLGMILGAIIFSLEKKGD